MRSDWYHQDAVQKGGLVDLEILLKMCSLSFNCQLFGAVHSDATQLASFITPT